MRRGLDRGDGHRQINLRLPNSEAHMARLMGTIINPRGIVAWTATAASRAPMPTITNPTGQLAVSLTYAPSGMPTTEAIDQPTNTKAIALPRRSTGTSNAAVEAA